MTFEEAVDDILSRENWRYADRDALWKMMYQAGVEAERARCHDLCKALDNDENTGDYRNCAAWCAELILAKNECIKK